MSSICQRYCGPLRLPGQPGGDFGVRLIRPGGPPVGHWPGSPVVPSGAVPACHPCYPGGPQMTRQRWWSPEHRSSSPDNGVDALTEVNEATPGFAARYGLRGCARLSDALVRELGALGYPSHLPRATRARCPLPGPDFHRQVPEYPRHTVRYHFSTASLALQVPSFLSQEGTKANGVGTLPPWHPPRRSATPSGPPEQEEKMADTTWGPLLNSPESVGRFLGCGAGAFKTPPGVGRAGTG